MSTKSWDANIQQFVWQMGDNEERNYYETFTNSVKDAAKTNAGLTVYPVPARNELNVKLNLTSAQNATITLHDATGSVVKVITTPTAAQYSQRIDVSNLPAGHYIVRMVAGSAVSTQHVNIVK
jgi:hypothetical protein